MLFDFALWTPVTNHSDGGVIRPLKGLVLHTESGTESGSEAWFCNPASQASAHFGNPKNDRLRQLVDTDNKAWAEAGGNPYWISLENEGNAEALTLTQLDNAAHLMAWLHVVEAVPLQISNDPATPGLGWHGMGGQFWGGHINCLPLDTTEVLTPQGWLLLSDVTMETMVASWDSDSNILEFNKPLGVIEPYLADTISLADFEMTPNHRVYVKRKDATKYKVLQAQDEKIINTDNLIPCSGELNTSGIEISDDFLRFLVWVQADGSYEFDNSNGKLYSLQFHFSKQRKIDRVCELLTLIGKEFSIVERKNGTTVIRVYGEDWINDNILALLPDKKWTWDILNIDQRQFEIVDEEICKADGHERSDMRIFSTAIENNADIIQALYVTHGRSAAKHGKEGAWIVQFHVERTGHTCRNRRSEARKNILVGCITTQHDTILIRQGDNVAIVGNCPGEIIKAQRQDILDRAQQLLGATSMSNFPNAVMAIQCPTGGTWVVGSDGGVGAYGGAPYLGSYPGLADSLKQGTRRFLNIVPNDKPGYTLLADDGSQYAFPL